jgi:putative iron-regulated protein
MKKLAAYFLLVSVIIFQQCSDDNEASYDTLQKQAIQNYANIVYASYDDSYKTVELLRQKIGLFVINLSPESFEQCKIVWEAARAVYGQTEAFRFYGGPIDNETGPEGLINAWPIDEGYIDYVADNADAGIINNPGEYPTIDKALLTSLNENGSETNISTGYHAIEFLLWGQDVSASGPGNRSYTDFISGPMGTAKNQDRRMRYLIVVTDLLLEHLKSVRDEWKEGAAYRTAFVNNSNASETLEKIFTGLGELSKGELAGERMSVAVEEQDQEHEHSCFSDNTLTDIKMNFLGIKNVYTGTYKRIDNSVVSGVSFQHLAEKTNKTKADAVAEAFQDAELKINAIPGPFDQAILTSKDLIINAVVSLRTLSDRLADVGSDLKNHKH